MSVDVYAENLKDFAEVVEGRVTTTGSRLVGLRFHAENPDDTVTLWFSCGPKGYRPGDELPMRRLLERAAGAITAYRHRTEVRLGED